MGMWMASLSGSSPGHLALSFTVVSSYLLLLVLPNILCYHQLLQSPSLAGIPVLPQSSLEPPPGFLNVYIGLAKAAGDPVRDLGLLLRWQVVLHLGPH